MTHKNFNKHYNSKFPLAALISIIYRTHNTHLNHLVEKFNLTVGQIPFILHLLNKENVSQDDLANDLFIDKGTVAIALKKLEDEGFVERKRFAENRRKYLIFFTPKGKEIALKIKKLNMQWEDMLLNDLSSFEKKEFMERINILSFKSIEIMKEK